MKHWAIGYLPKGSAEPVGRRTTVTVVTHRYRLPVPTLGRENWTVENTLTMPTLKLKRNNLAARLAPQIERFCVR